jgi:hypothetical protein
MGQTAHSTIHAKADVRVAAGAYLTQVRQPLKIDGACDRYVLQMSLGKPSIP